MPVTGNVSPYPTVVTVVAAHHSASPNVVMCAPGACRSASSTDRAAIRMRIAAAVATA